MWKADECENQEIGDFDILGFGDFFCVSFSEITKSRNQKSAIKVVSKADIVCIGTVLFEGVCNLSY